MNKSSKFEGEQQNSRCGNGEYYYVLVPDREVLVSRRMAAFVEEQLSRWRKPKWIAFVDIFGSRVRVQSKMIWAVLQSNEEQRAAERAFERGCQQEFEADE